MLAPVRHARPHVGFVWWTSPTALQQRPGMSSGYLALSSSCSSGSDDKLQAAVVQLMGLVEATVPFQLQAFGMVWSAALSRYMLVPEGLHQNTPSIFSVALAVASHLGMPDIDGVKYGTQVKRTNTVTGAARARPLVWCNASRQNYKVVDVNPLRQNNLKSTSP